MSFASIFTWIKTHIFRMTKEELVEDIEIAQNVTEHVKNAATVVVTIDPKLAPIAVTAVALDTFVDKVGDRIEAQVQGSGKQS